LRFFVLQAFLPVHSRSIEEIQDQTATSLSSKISSFTFPCVCAFRLIDGIACGINDLKSREYDPMNFVFVSL
tara:strand:- start:1726 stop:1941 length:216 start_codon:yes stop_codon:yes gene_type:complete